MEKEFYEQILVTDIGELFSLMKKKAKDRFVDTKVGGLPMLRPIIILPSKKSLQLKKGISKFEFHLIGHQFLVEMDMSSFPKMLKFKQKDIPHPNCSSKWNSFPNTPLILNT